MKRNRWRRLLPLALAILILSGCASAEEIPPAETEQEGQTEEESVPTRYTRHYGIQEKELAADHSAVLFQDGSEKGFLALISRKTGEEIPEDLKNDPDFFNDGRYDVYENELVFVNREGRQRSLKGYSPLHAPENSGDREEYFSESRARAFLLREDETVLALESSYEAWQDPRSSPHYQTELRYYLRVLERDGRERSCSELVFESEDSPNFSEAVSIGDLLAFPQGKSVQFYGTDGGKRFSVETPFPVSELCRAEERTLAVILEEGSEKWLSIVDVDARTATVPENVPGNAHAFCRGAETGQLLFLRESELFSWKQQTAQSEKLISLFTLQIDPMSVGAFYAGRDGSLHFLIHDRMDTGSVHEVYLAAMPEEVPTDRRILTLGFSGISGSLTDLILRFNGSRKDLWIETVDFRNLDGQVPASGDSVTDIVVMDEALYGELLHAGQLADLSEMFLDDPKYPERSMIASVRRGLSDGESALFRLSGVFRIESMACDRSTAGGKSSLSMEELRQILSAMPTGSSLYEPYYTSDRLLKHLAEANRLPEEEYGRTSPELRGKLEEFSRLQPEHYDYRSYAADTESMERRIYSGRLLMLQAHIGSLEELKWYDAFFPGGASFPGWPGETGSQSLFRFDESLGISSDARPEVRRAAWQFVREILSETYMQSHYGFPVREAVLNGIIIEDMENIEYLVDEKGKPELDRNGNRIERARSTWYSPEWRRHGEYALTAAQREKLMTLIRQAV